MTQTIAHTGFTQDTFNHFLSTRNEPAWLTDLRREAWRKFTELPD